MHCTCKCILIVVVYSCGRMHGIFRNMLGAVTCSIQSPTTDFIPITKESHNVLMWMPIFRMKSVNQSRSQVSLKRLLYTKTQALNVAL